MKNDLTVAFRKVFGDVRTRAATDVAVAWVASPVGPLLLAATAKGLCWLEFSSAEELAHRRERLQKIYGEPIPANDHPVLERTKMELAEYFAGSRKEFTVPLDFAGTPFQQSVWQNLLHIPYGQTWSYAELAVAVKKAPTACRAVGQANGRNPIAIIVPCHRVINKGGGLGGYGGERWRKEKLLQLEGVLSEQ